MILALLFAYWQTDILTMPQLCDPEWLCGIDESTRNEKLKMYWHDLDVMGSNSGRIELGVHGSSSTSGLSCT